MAPNASATLPDQAPMARLAPQQPPADTIWLQYHPWMEGLVGHGAAWAIHIGVIGTILFFVYAFAHGWIKWDRSKDKIQMQAAEFEAVGGGGGSPTGSGQDHGEHAAPKEGVHADKNSSGNTNTPTPPPDAPHLDGFVPHPSDVSFTPPILVENPDAMRSVSGLENALRDKLSGGGSSRGNGGPGTGGGTGTGTGTGTGAGTGPGNGGKVVAKNERMKRMDRWEMALQTNGDKDFLLRLQMIGTTLAIPDDPDHLDATKYTLIDLAKQPPEIKNGADVTDLDQIWVVHRRTEGHAGAGGRAAPARPAEADRRLHEPQPGRRSCQKRIRFHAHFAGPDEREGGQDLFQRGRPGAAEVGHPGHRDEAAVVGGRAVSEMDLQARRDAAKADARAARALESANDLRQKLEAPVAALMRTVLAVIDALQRKGVLDAADAAAEIEQLRQVQTALRESRNPFYFT